MDKSTLGEGDWPTARTLSPFSSFSCTASAEGPLHTNNLFPWSPCPARSETLHHGPTWHGPELRRIPKPSTPWDWHRYRSIGVVEKGVNVCKDASPMGRLWETSPTNGGV